jgi:SET domain-containing protein
VKGETLIEYVGEIISAQEAEDRHPMTPNDPNHTFYFQVDDDKVIDALHGGNYKVDQSLLHTQLQTGSD